MGVKDKIIEAQRKVIDRLAQFEALIADLYDAYGAALPEMVDFWRALSHEERIHAERLRSLHSLLDKGKLFYNLTSFDMATIDALIKEIQAEIIVANRKTVTRSQALTTALSIEKSIVEGKFYANVKSDATEFSVIADHLAKSTERHCKLVQDQFLNMPE